jgi:hypothetical protein
MREYDDRARLRVREPRLPEDVHSAGPGEVTGAMFHGAGPYLWCIGIGPGICIGRLP